MLKLRGLLNQLKTHSKKQGKRLDRLTRLRYGVERWKDDTA